MSAASSLNTGTARFNAEAAAWDSNPFVHSASRHALEALLPRFPRLNMDNPILDVLEIGCGTGLLTYMVAPYARHVVAVDAAQGMVEVLKGKLERDDAPKNVTAVCVLLEDAEDVALPSGSDAGGGKMKFDLIVSHLVLHHIPELEPVLTTMFDCLRPGGWIALTDFEHTGPEARAFHPKVKMDGVERDGIEPGEMEGLIRRAGFESAKVERVWSMEKNVERFEGEFGKTGKPDKGRGEIREFPFVVCMGTKPRRK